MKNIKATVLIFAAAAACVAQSPQSAKQLRKQEARLRKELDPAKRQQLYVDLQKKIINDVDMIPVAMVLDRSMNVATLKGMPTIEPLWGLDLTRLYFQ